MLKKYEENVYLISQIFGSEPIDESDDDDNSSASDAIPENEPMEEEENDDNDGNDVNDEKLPSDLPPALIESIGSLSKNRKELEQAYQKIFAEQQSLEKFQDEELDSFEGMNKDFHQLFHELKQAKLKKADIEGYFKRSKELGVYADSHPAIITIEGPSTKPAQRPFTEMENIDYDKL